MYSCLLIASCLVIVSSAAPQQRLQWQRLIDASRDEGGEEDHVITFPSLTELDDEWQSFKSKYGKTYADALEETTRKEIFANHVRAIIKHNYLHTRGLKSFTMGINEFSDLEHSEFLKKMTCYKPFKNLSATSTGSTFLTPEVNFTLPSKVDWRPRGYVTEIKHQGSCGSCWAFSATGSLEGQYSRKSKKLVSLSEQQLVDCSRGFGNHGCDGGDASYAFDYIKSANGLDTEESYPYEAKDGKCRYKPASRGATCRGHVNIKKNSEVELMTAVAIVGPISVAIDASRKSFKSYKSGVYYTPSCGTTPTKLNHAVLVVGYGTSQEDGDYWIVKNSWGIEWGMEGYIWMSRNRDNQCGIATEALYPLV